MSAELGVGRLLLVPTPIGNLGDITARSVEALRDADAIACEDTRRTRTLLSALCIAGKRLLAVHEHNESQAAAGLVGLALQGQIIALVTDAGMPAISDPGALVVRGFLDEGLGVEALPGASAFVVALAISGLDTTRFTFEGFLPAKGKRRRELLEVVATEVRTTVLYESPHRILETIDDLALACGAHRRVAICRELTKLYETVIRSTLGDALATLRESEPRGEYVIVLAGATAVASHEFTDELLIERLDALRTQGLRTRDAVDAVVAQTREPRKRVYSLATRRVD